MGGGGSDPPKDMQHHPGGGVGRDFRCPPLPGSDVHLLRSPGHFFAVSDPPYAIRLI